MEAIDTTTGYVMQQGSKERQTVSLWRGIYLGKLPSLTRKIEVTVDWVWKLLFPPNIVQLQLSRTAGVGRAHYAAGEFVVRKGDAGGQFFVIESGTAGVSW